MTAGPKFETELERELYSALETVMRGWGNHRTVNMDDMQRLADAFAALAATEGKMK
jgi:hypothetical protein